MIHRLDGAHRLRRLRRVGGGGRGDQQRERGEQIAPREGSVFVLVQERIEILHARTIRTAIASAIDPALDPARSRHRCCSTSLWPASGTISNSLRPAQRREDAFGMRGPRLAIERAVDDEDGDRDRRRRAQRADLVDDELARRARRARRRP